MGAFGVGAFGALATCPSPAATSARNVAIGECIPIREQVMSWRVCISSIIRGVILRIIGIMSINIIIRPYTPDIYTNIPYNDSYNPEILIYNMLRISI